MAGNLAKAKNASPEMKEALTRFYGAKRVNAAMGKSTAKTPVAKSSGPGGKMSSKPKGGPGAKVAPKAKSASATTAKSKSSFAPSGRKTTPVERGYEKVYNRVTSQGSKPFVDVPKRLGAASSAMKTRAAANQALLEKNRKARMENAKKLKK
jgi:hypothetical protein